MLAVVTQASTKAHFTLRIGEPIKRALSRQAARHGLSRTGLAEQYLEEAIRAADHPGIVFRDGPAGRRAALVGGPDVWEVVGTFLAEDQDVEATARYLNLSIGLTRTAVGYYIDNKAEIDAWISRNELIAEQSEADWRRRRNLDLG